MKRRTNTIRKRELNAEDSRNIIILHKVSVLTV